jgi:FG-GAP-like repeat
MKPLTKFISAALTVLIFAMGAGAANGGVPTSRPRPTPAPRPTPPLTADVGSSYSNSKVTYSLDIGAILTTLGYPPNDPAPVAYGDFNRDGIPDVVFGDPVSTTGGPPLIALGQPGGYYINGTTQVISGKVPAPVGARKILVADFNGDGWPDIFIVDFGLDAPPFPGSHDWLLLSDGTGHLVNQSALAAIDPVGSHHTATAGDIDHSGHIDIFVENQHPDSFHYFLINDGQGNFTVDTTRVPYSLNHSGSTPFWSSELIDVDNDGNLDLVIGGPEAPNFLPTEIFWGDGTGFYSDANKTILPTEPAWDTILDIDSEDINHDGLRDLVINRTNDFYTGFYFQVLMQTSRRVFADESLPRLIHDRSTWIGNNARYVNWIHLVDITGDGAPDLVVDNAGSLQGWGNGLGWANDGNGFFNFTGGWLKVIWTTPLVGGTFSPPAPGTYSYDVSWNKPVDPTSVEPTDLTLSGIQGATVTGVAVINGNLTTEFTLDISTGGRLTASIAAGAITSQSGHPNVAFSGSYPVSPWAPRPSPTPRLHPIPPPRP